MSSVMDVLSRMPTASFSSQELQLTNFSGTDTTAVFHAISPAINLGFPIDSQLDSLCKVQHKIDRQEYKQ